MSDGNNPPAPRGRGAFLYAALLEKQKKQQVRTNFFTAQVPINNLIPDL